MIGSFFAMPSHLDRRSARTDQSAIAARCPRNAEPSLDWSVSRLLAWPSLTFRSGFRFPIPVSLPDRRQRMRRSVWLAVSVLAALLGPASSPARAQGLPYPTYTPYQIKGIGAETPDEWLWGQMIGNYDGGMVTNLPWA